MSKKRTKAKAKKRANVKGKKGETVLVPSEAFEITTPQGPKTIKSEADYRAVVSIAREVKTHLGLLEDDRQRIIVPIRSALDRLYEKHREAKRSLEAIESACKQSMEAWAAKAAAKAIKTAERKAAKASNKEMGREIVEAAREQDHVPKLEGVSYRTEYTFKIESPDAVPTMFQGIELRPVNESAIRRLVKASKGAIEIPGVIVSIEKKATIKT